MKLYQYVSSYTYIRLLTSCSKSWRGHLSLHVGGVPMCQYLLYLPIFSHNLPGNLGTIVMLPTEGKLK